VNKHIKNDTWLVVKYRCRILSIYIEISCIPFVRYVYMYIE